MGKVQPDGEMQGPARWGNCPLSPGCRDFYGVLWVGEELSQLMVLMETEATPGWGRRVTHARRQLGKERGRSLMVTF